MVVLSFLDTLKEIRYTLPPCQQPFYAGFWWLMRWYVRLPRNDQVYQSKLAKTAALRCFHSSAFGKLYGPGVFPQQRIGTYALQMMHEIYMEACVDVALDSDIATEVRDRLQKHHARGAFLKEVLCRQSASSGSSQLPLVQPSGSSLLALMSSSSGSSELPLVQPSDPPMSSSQPPLVQDKKDKKAKDKKDKQHKKDKKDKLPLVQPPEDGHYYILLQKRKNEKDKKDKKDKKHKKAKRDLPEDMPEDPRQ